MDSIKISAGLTLKDLVRETGAPPHVVRYLNGLGRLPIQQQSPGPGYPILYSNDAVLIIKEHLMKSDRYQSKDTAPNKSK